MFNRRRRKETPITSDPNIIDGATRTHVIDMLGDNGRSRNLDRMRRKDKRTERRAKRRKFFLALSSNVKWIMVAAAVIAVLLFAKFGIPSMLSGGV